MAEMTLRQTPDGFVVECTTSRGLPVRLTVSGLTEGPLVLEQTCGACGASLGRREFTGPAPDDVIDTAAAVDGFLALTHTCKETTA